MDLQQHVINVVNTQQNCWKEGNESGTGIWKTLTMQKLCVKETAITWKVRIEKGRGQLNLHVCFIADSDNGLIVTLLSRKLALFGLRVLSRSISLRLVLSLFDRLHVRRFKCSF